MAQKRNEYLDVSEDDEDRISESDNQEDGRTARIKGHASKRRKLDRSESEDSDAEKPENEHHDEESDVEATHSVEASTSPQKDAPGKASAMLPGLKLSKTHQQKKKKTGVIYISRIPPFMKPSALRHLLTPYGTLLRIFLTPEPTPSYIKRVKSGGNKKRSFVDGWVEFASKRAAKICAETLNGNIIGGKKGGWYHDDLWNIKYLRGFKWDDLMEQVQDEERIRQGRLRAEIKQEAKERRAFLDNIEQDKMEKTREAKRKKRLGGSGGPDEVVETQDADQRVGWTQNKVKQRDKKTTTEPQDDVKRVLSKLF